MIDMDTTEVTDSSSTPHLFGRREIMTSERVITRENLLRVLTDTLAIHNQNSSEIEYLYRYMRGNQPVLYRKKKIRPEICSRTVENHAFEVADFTANYTFSEPVTYVQRGESAALGDDISRLNDYMYICGKDSKDKDMATWMAACGVGYRMILPSEPGNPCPFVMDVPDPRTTFVVYYSGFGHEKLMAVREIYHYDTNYAGRVTYSIYTKNRYFEVEEGRITVEQPHSMGFVPVYRYRLNMPMLSSFEPAIPLMNVLSEVLSCRMDGLNQFVQSFLKFKNCEIESDTVAKLRELGAIVIKSQQGMDSDVDIMSQELNQTQTQTLVDYLYDRILSICGMPTSTKGGASTSDTGAGVFLRDGWSQCESRAKETEMLYKQEERTFLTDVLSLCDDLSVKPWEIECKFTRRQYENLLVKTQALVNMLNAGIAPEVSIASCGLFNDPLDVYKQSSEYLRKWEYQEPLSDEPETEQPDGGEDL